MDAQYVSDLNEHINRFERRLHDLLLSRAIAIQTAPQIRLIQRNDQSLAEKSKAVFYQRFLSGRAKSFWRLL